MYILFIKIKIVVIVPSILVIVVTVHCSRFMSFCIHHVYIINSRFPHLKRSNGPPILAQDLRVPRPWDQWPSNLMLPMMLMRENLKKSIFQSVGVNPPASLDLSITPKPKLNRQPTVQQENGGFVCGDCGRTYKLKSSLRNHQKWECGKEPQFQCPYCIYKAKQKMHMARHMERMHREIDYSSVIKREMKNESEGGDSKESSDGLRDYSMLKNVTTEMKIDEGSSSC